MKSVQHFGGPLALFSSNTIYIKRNPFNNIPIASIFFKQTLIMVSLKKAQVPLEHQVPNESLLITYHF